MAILNNQTSVLQAAGVGHRWTNMWFLPNGAAQPVSFGGAYVASVVRTGVGAFTVTLRGFSPRAFLGAECYAFDAALPTTVDTRIVTSFVINPAAKTVVFQLQTTTAVPNALRDIPANPLSVVKYSLLWKVFQGEDSSGL